MEDEIKMTPKGGNSPVRFFLYLNEEKIGMLQKIKYRAYFSSYCNYYWVVDVYNPKYKNRIIDYIQNNEGIERFYWGWIIWSKEKQH